MEKAPRSMEAYQCPSAACKGWRFKHIADASVVSACIKFNRPFKKELTYKAIPKRFERDGQAISEQRGNPSGGKFPSGKGRSGENNRTPSQADAYRPAGFRTRTRYHYHYRSTKTMAKTKGYGTAATTRASNSTGTTRQACTC